MLRTSIAAYLSLALLAASCGDDAGGGTTESSLAATTTAQVARVAQGQAASIVIDIERIEFEGEVDVIVEDLPAAVTAQVVTVPAASSKATLVIEAASAAEQQGPTTITIVAAAADDPSLSATLTIPLYVAGAPGSFDVSFNSDGTVATRISDRDADRVSDAVLDSKGRIVVVGAGEGVDPNIGWVARFDSTGRLDESFGSAGVITGFLNGYEESGNYRVAVQGDQLTVLTAAITADPPSNASFLSRINEDGSFDDSYGSAGYSQVFARATYLAQREVDHVAFYWDVAAAVDSSGNVSGDFELASLPSNVQAVAAQGNEIVAGTSGISGDFGIIRLTETGALDGSFASSGQLTVPVFQDHSFPVVRDLAVRAEEGVALGEASFGNVYDSTPAVFRFSKDGALDTTFGESGILRLLGLNQRGFARRIAWGQNERILVAVTRLTDNAVLDNQVIRLTSDGRIDQSFGDGGAVTIEGEPYGLVVDHQAGRVVVVSTTTSGMIHVTRLWL